MASKPAPIPEPSSSALHLKQIASLREQIQQLVDKNAKIQRELMEEKGRSEITLKNISIESNKSVEEYSSALLASKVNQIDLVELIEDQKAQIASLVRQSNQRRVAIIARDIRLATFQDRERQLEDEADHLRDLLNQAQQTYIAHLERIQKEYEQNLDAIQTSSLESSAVSKARAVELSTLKSEVNRTKALLLASESTLTTARGDVESLRTDLERLRLELKEEQRDNRELRDQIKDWKRLEGKGQETRIRCTELEVELKVERERVADLEERLKVAKTWRKELKASKEEVEVLKTATNALRENAIRNDIVSPLKRRRDETEDEADEVEAVSRPSKKSKKAPAEPILESGSEPEKATSKGVKPKPKGKPRMASKAPTTDDQDDQFFHPVAPSKKNTSADEPVAKPRQKKRIVATKRDDDQDGDDIGKGKGKKKITKPNNDDSEGEQVTSKLKPKKAETSTKSSKNVVSDDNKGSNALIAPKPKKRTMNLLGGPSTLGAGTSGVGSWLTGGDNMYGIPITLSSPEKAASNLKNEPFAIPRSNFRFGQGN